MTRILITGATGSLPSRVRSRMYSRSIPDRAATPELWTSGRMAVLSPAAIAMLIILRVQVGAKDPDTEEVWIAPDYAEKAFLLSEETRTRGLRELQRAGLIGIRRRQLVATDSFTESIDAKDGRGSG